MDIEKIISIAKRRGFVFPSSEIYGGLSGFFDLGPVGILLKRKIDIADYITVLMGRNLNFMDLLPLIRRNADQFKEAEYKEIMDTGL
jgi:glycyl-tRNA synthetase (class II)